jgi:hypothetical protein
MRFSFNHLMNPLQILVFGHLIPRLPFYLLLFLVLDQNNLGMLLTLLLVSFVAGLLARFVAIEIIQLSIVAADINSLLLIPILLSS